jgi:hypothetical protein
VLPKVPGGLYHFATVTAAAGNWSLLGDTRTYDEVRQKVATFLDNNGYSDAAHTTITALENPDATECGAEDKAEPAIGYGITENNQYEVNGQVRPLRATLAGLNGLEPTTELQNNGFGEVILSLEHYIQNEFFEGYNPVTYRDALRQNDPGKLEILESDPHHAMHLHVEDGIGINEIENTTLDRDNNGGKLFWYDRWFTRLIAHNMADTEAEAQRLLMAGDYFTLMISNQLVAKDTMPAALYAIAA